MLKATYIHFYLKVNNILKKTKMQVFCSYFFAGRGGGGGAVGI